MNSYQIPIDISNDFGAWLEPATPTKNGAFRLVNMRRSSGGHEDRRIVVYLIDENGMAMSNVPVAFSYSTADPFSITGDFLWRPPQPFKAHIAKTIGGGQIENILSEDGVIEPGGSGGISCYVLTPEYSSDEAHGLGMLPDHTSLVLTFQLQRVGVLPLAERLAEIEARLTALEAKLAELEQD